MKQTTFASLAFDHKKKLTRRERFLQEMDAVVPWASLLKRIAPHYPKAGNGRQPMALETMLRIYFLQQWLNLSDPAAEDSLYDIESMRRLSQKRLLLKSGTLVDATIISRGLVHTATTTTAKHADITQLPALLHGKESVVHGDRGYYSKDANAWLKKRGIRSRLQKRAAAGQPARRHRPGAQQEMVRGARLRRASLPRHQAPVGLYQGSLSGPGQEHAQGA